MLTKEFIKPTVNSGSIYPKYLAKADKSAALAEAVLSLYRKNLGENRKDFATALKQLSQANNTHKNIVDALAKIVDDKSSWQDMGEDCTTLRWQVFEKSNELLRSQTFDDLEHFQQSLADHFNKPCHDLQESLYGDLPENQKLQSTPELDQDSLLNHYNLQQVQGILIKALWLKIDLKSLPSPKRKLLIHAVKFLGLLMEIKQVRSSGDAELHISGPQNIFQNATKYGLQFAKFFNIAIGIDPKLKIQALIRHNKKDLDFTYNPKRKILSTTPPKESEAPAALLELIAACNKKNPGFHCKESQSIIHLKDTVFLCPEIMATFLKDKTAVHVEIIQKGRKEQLIPLIQAARQYNLKNNEKIIFAIDRAAAKDKAVQKQVAEEFDDIAFFYRSWPTAGQLVKGISALGDK